MFIFSKKIIYIIIAAVILVVAVFLVIYFYFVPQKGASSPNQTIESFYQWYVNQPERPLLSGSYAKSGFLTSGFADKMAKKASDFKNTGFDAFLCAANTVPSFSAVQQPKVLAGQAQVVVEQVDGLKTNQVKVSLVLEKRNWKISDIECFVAKPEEMALKVYFSNSEMNPNMQDCGQVFPVERVVVKTQQTAQAALSQLFNGPTDIEKANGYTSWFSPQTADILESVNIKDGIAYVNLKHDFTSIISGVSSSCGGVEFLAEMTQTLKQFPTIK
ncbi:MAG: GerMN domain-containing protein, partial [Candidatus Pacebacteria bacterium]|nr:GerMN domain-containing protein [Candidatus Paceibacterota bacterium]